MVTTTYDRGERDRPTIGVDAVPLDRFADVGTEDGQLLVYDRDNETAWVQADLYVPRETML
jgi:hypothetical protein